MTHNTASALGFATAIALAGASIALISASAYAETIAEYTTPFVGTLTRAEVRTELQARPELLSAAASEWATQHNEPVGMGSAQTRADAKSEYRSARQEVLATSGEDSGSAYFLRQAKQMKTSATLGGPAR